MHSLCVIFHLILRVAKKTTLVELFQHLKILFIQFEQNSTKKFVVYTCKYQSLIRWWWFVMPRKRLSMHYFKSFGPTKCKKSVLKHCDKEFVEHLNWCIIILALVFKPITIKCKESMDMMCIRLNIVRHSKFPLEQMNRMSVLVTLKSWKFSPAIICLHYKH